MNRKREKDEHIEQLYYMKEDSTDSMAALKSTMNENYDATIIDELSSALKITIKNLREKGLDEIVKDVREKGDEE